MVNVTKETGARFLVMMPMGIGDAVAVGLSTIDQIIKNDPAVDGAIDVVCNHLQADIFRHDPRINSIICIDSSIFPTPDIRTWIKGIVLEPEALKLIAKLRSSHYEGVFPGNTTPFFHRRLQAPIMHMSLLKLFRDFLSLRSHTDRPVSQITRQIVNAYFGNRLPEPAIDAEIPLYVTTHHIQKARAVIEGIKEQANVSGNYCQLVMVAPDTSSIVTRPPTNLLAQGIAEALRRKHHLVIYILAGYTDIAAAGNLYAALSPDFSGRIFMLPHELRPTPLETTALIDQADVFVTGDTGMMHLAVTTRKLGGEEDSSYSPRNPRKTIVLFGGTNPGLHGYSKQTLILGRGRKEQAALAPGIFKEAYYGQQRNFFDHISPQQLTSAIISQLEGEEAMS